MLTRLFRHYLFGEKLQNTPTLIIGLTACDDYDKRIICCIRPCIPWKMGDAECGMTEERLARVFRYYIGVLTDNPIEIDYPEVENGG